MKIKDIISFIDYETSWLKLINAMVAPHKLTGDDLIAVPCLNCVKAISTVLKNDPS